MPAPPPPHPPTGLMLRRPEALRELRAVSRLAAPVVVAQVGMMLMGVVDTMMLGRYSTEALAAGALGNTVSFGLTIFAMGFLMALDPLVSQAHGAGDRAAVRRHLQRGLVAALLLSLGLGVLMWEIGWLLRLVRQPANLIEDTATYIRATVPGLPAYLVFVVFRQTLQAMGSVRQAVLAILVANLLNVGVNYALIFGNLGAPELGVLGSGYATSLSRWALLAVILAAGLKPLRPYLRKPGRDLLRLASYRTLTRLGIPIGIQISVEVLLFTVMALLMGTLGANALAAHQITINVASLSFMVPLGISGAAAARVGQAIGRGDSAGTRTAAMVSLGLGSTVMLLSAFAFAVFPRALARAYTPDVTVIDLVATLLPIAAIFQIFDGLQAVGAGVLRGAADTRVPAIIAVVGYWGVGLGLGSTFTFYLGWGPQGLWWGITLGLAAAAFLFLWRIWRLLAGELRRVEET